MNRHIWWPQVWFGPEWVVQESTSSYSQAHPLQVPQVKLPCETLQKCMYLFECFFLPCKGMVAAAIAMKRMSTFRCRYFRWVMKLNFPSVVSICWQCMAELCVCVSVVRKKGRGLLSFRCIFIGKFIKFFEKSSIYVFDSW